MHQPRRMRSSAAFTLLEIMLVVMIIALLSSAAIFLLKDSLVVAKEKKVESDIKSISTQLMLYENLNGYLPTAAQGIQALVEKPASDPIPKKWRRLMSALPEDPWGNVYVLETPARRSKENFDLFSKGPDRESGTDDDIGNW